MKSTHRVAGPHQDVLRRELNSLLETEKKDVGCRLARAQGAFAKVAAQHVVRR